MKKQKTINVYSCKCVLDDKVSSLVGPPGINGVVFQSIVSRNMFSLFKTKSTKFHLINILKLLAIKLNLISLVYKHNHILPNYNEPIHEVLITSLKLNIKKFQYNKLAMKSINLKVNSLNRLDDYINFKRVLYSYL